MSSFDLSLVLIECIASSVFLFMSLFMGIDSTRTWHCRLFPSHKSTNFCSLSDRLLYFSDPFLLSYVGFSAEC